MMKTFLEYHNQKIKTLLMVYAGRFQPPCKHHRDVFQWMQKKTEEYKKNFQNVLSFICMSNSTEDKDSPFNFEQKKQMWVELYGIDPTKIIQTESPYKPKELTDEYAKDSALVFVVGEKDKDRLNDQDYYVKSDHFDRPYTEKAYILVAPHISKKIEGGKELDGTEARKLLKGIEQKSFRERESIFQSVFDHRYDEAIGSMIDKALTK